MPGSYCHITKYPEPQRWTRVECGYNPDFISVLKKIPFTERTRNDRENYWTVAPAWYDMVVKAAKTHFNQVYVINGDKAVQLNG